MKYIILAYLLFIHPTVYAGEKGNGGYSVVCRNESGQIVSAELLDLYEGRIIYKKSYLPSENSIDEIIQISLRKIDDNTFLNFIKNELSKFEKNKIFIPSGNELEPTDDALPTIRKKGCNFEQLANYQSSGEILISEEIYNHLDNKNKAALTLHEVIYSIRRKSVRDVTSQVTRKIVSQLLATEPDIEIIQRWISDTLYRPNNTTPCGLEGSIFERIESCQYTKQASPPLYLVTRTEEGKEVWMDQSKKILWSDRFKEYVNFEEAISSCASIHEEMGFLYDFEWRLPRIEEFFSNGGIYLYILPNMNRFGDALWFWTSTTKGKSIMIFNGADGQSGSTPFRNLRNGSVRCVANLNL